MKTNHTIHVQLAQVQSMQWETLKLDPWQDKKNVVWQQPPHICPSIWATTSELNTPNPKLQTLSLRHAPDISQHNHRSARCGHLKHTKTTIRLRWTNETAEKAIQVKSFPILAELQFVGHRGQAWLCSGTYLWHFQACREPKQHIATWNPSFGKQCLLTATAEKSNQCLGTEWAADGIAFQVR